jgi:hypothetical protein
MLKLFEQQTVSLYQVQKDLKLSPVRLYKYARGQRRIENMPSKLLLDLAYYFKIEVNTLNQSMLDYQEKRDK